MRTEFAHVGRGESVIGEEITFETVSAVLDGGRYHQPADALWERVDAARAYLQRRVAAGAVVYGVNTGFGSLQSSRIQLEDLEQLQVNLLRSHACGTGAIVSDDVVRLMLLLKAQALLQGHSGVQRETIERLLLHLEHDILPVVHAQGSLGASGDLAPLAHLALPLLGEGRVRVDGREEDAADVLARMGWAPVRLGPKEGLALINGTQFMTAHGCLAVVHAERLAVLADVIGAMSLDAFGGRAEPYDALVHHVRPHPGQQACAARMRHLLRDSELLAVPKVQMQDPYSFRAIPQVHGASIDTISFVRQVVEREMNSVSDNPLVFADHDRIISAANFHGQPLALAFDFLAIALAEFGSISERRIFQLIAGKNGLPNYLIRQPGLNCGFMIPQYTAASVVSQSKQLCSPASVDSIVSSNGQEDHVSMGANAATKLLAVVENVYTVLAIELFTAAQALEFRRPVRSSPLLEAVHAQYRSVVPFLDSDDLMRPHIQHSIAFLKTLDLSELQTQRSPETTVSGRSGKS